MARNIELCNNCVSFENGACTHTQRCVNNKLFTEREPVAPPVITNDDIDLDTEDSSPVAPTEMPKDIRPRYTRQSIVYGKLSDVIPYTWQLKKFIKLYASFAFSFKAPEEFTYREMNSLLKTFEEKVRMGKLKRRDYEHTYEQECCRVARKMLERYPYLKSPKSSDGLPENKQKGITLKMVTEGSGFWDYNYKMRNV